MITTVIGRTAAAALLACAAVAPLGAQDFGMSIHESFSNNRNAIMGSHIAKLNSPAYKRMSRGGGAVARPAAGGTVGLLGSAFAADVAPAGRQTAAALGFATSAASSKQAVEEFVGRVKTKDPGAAAELQQQLGRHNVSSIYSGIVRPFGLSASNLADVTTAYVVLGWMVANQAGDPSVDGVRAVRDKVATILATNPQLKSAAMRTTVGEEVKVLFVVLHAGMQGATKSGEMSAFSDGTRAMFQQIAGEDFRRYVLTDQGFARRG